MEEEVWKPLIGYEKRCHVSSLGNVRSFTKYKNGESQRESPIDLKPCKDSRVYYNFTVLSKESKKTLCIHREVAKLFVPNPNPKKYKIVRHLNDIKTDNRAVNLALGTYKDNRQDGIRNGTQFHEPGKRAAQRKLNEEIVRMVMKSTKNNSELGRQLGVTESTISKIRVGRGWNHVTGLPRLK